MLAVVVLLTVFVVLPVVLGAHRAPPAWAAFAPALLAVGLALYTDATEPEGYLMPDLGLQFFGLTAGISAGFALAGLGVRGVRGVRRER